MVVRYLLTLQLQKISDAAHCAHDHRQHAQTVGATLNVVTVYLDFFKNASTGPRSFARSSIAPSKSSEAIFFELFNIT